MTFSETVLCSLPWFHSGTSSHFDKIILIFFISKGFVPSSSAWLRYAHSFLLLELLQWIKLCEMEMRTLSLSVSLSFQTSKPGYASNVFLRSWSAAKSYKWSRERWRERVSRMQRKKKKRGAGQKDESPENEKWTRERGSQRDEDKARGWSKSIWAFAVLKPSPAQSLIFLLSNCSRILARDQLIRWRAATMPSKK